jgi:hypothetical protein
MSEFLTPQEFKAELKTNPLFFIVFIFENQPKKVMSVMAEKGFFIQNEEEALLTLKGLLEKGKGNVIYNILSSVELDFSKINEMYHAPLIEALKGK